jgi:hypothetical protein
MSNLFHILANESTPGTVTHSIESQTQDYTYLVSRSNSFACEGKRSGNCDVLPILRDYHTYTPRHSLDRVTREGRNSPTIVVSKTVMVAVVAVSMPVPEENRVDCRSPLNEL